MRLPRVSVCAAIVAVTVIGTADAKAAPQPPPIHGVTGTVATEATVRDTHEGAKILAKAAAGIGRLFGVKRRSTVPSGDAAGAEALRGLKEGKPVAVVRYTTEGENLTAEEIDRLDDDSLQRMEGVVTAVNPGDRTISIRLADGTLQTLRLSDRAAADAGHDIDRAGPGTANVIVSFKDEAGQRVAHFFTRVR